MQTSVALPPDTWDMLDQLAANAGISAGALLTAILTGAIPDEAKAALGAIEQLLVGMAPDETLHEERNYRLPLQLRTRLDGLAKALGPGPRLQRSLLIRAILAADTPASGEQAHALVTAQRIDAMRTALDASSAD